MTSAGDTAPGADGRSAAESAMELAQRAAGVVAARRRGDHAGAAALMNDFTDADARALGFYVVADLAVTLLSRALDRPIEECLREMSLVLAAGAPSP